MHLTLDDLKSKFKKHTVAAALQCTGNRRHELKEIKEVQVHRLGGTRASPTPDMCHAAPARRCSTQQSTVCEFARATMGVDVDHNVMLMVPAAGCCRAWIGMSVPSAMLPGLAFGCQTS